MLSVSKYFPNLRNFRGKNLFVLIFTVLVFASIPFTVFVVLNNRTTTPKADTIIPRGISGDLWADIVIGQRDFAEINPNEIVADKTFNPGGTIVDNSGSGSGRAYVWDGNNNRILGIDLAACYAKQSQGTRCAGQLVLGQPSLNDYGACNRDSSSQSTTRVPATAASLCGVTDAAFSLEEQRSMTNMVVDSSGNLYVADVINNRVLKYNNPFGVGSDSVADEVWGQADFTGNLPNGGGSRNASTLSFNYEYWGSGGVETHAGVALDSQGNLWVVDTANSRVLRFPKSGSQISKTADIVLGQSDFTSANIGSGLNQLKRPTSATFDTGGKLYIADAGNNRILVFPGSSLVSGAKGISAAGTFGSDFAHDQPYSPLNSCIPGDGYTGAYVGCDGNPWLVQQDPLNRGIWTSETVRWDSRVRLWGFDGTLLTTINHNTRIGGSLGIDKAGNVLLTAVSPNNEVFRYQQQANGSYTKVQNFFSPPGGINLVTNRRLTFSNGGGMTVIGNQLIVSDGRLLFWNGLNSLTNGKPADGYLRTNPTDNITDFTVLANPTFNYISGSSDKLWASTKNKILIYQSPFVTAATPIKTISSVNVFGGGLIDFAASGQQIAGIVASKDGNFVWVSQAAQHRVLRIKDPLSTSPVVDIILGQTGLTPNYCNRNSSDPANTNSYAEPIASSVSLNTLCYPGALGIDRLGNLYVSDIWHEIAGNQRLLMYSAATLPATTSSVLYAPNATKEFPRSQKFGTWQPSFDSTNRMVVGYNPYSKSHKRVDFFDNPTDSSTTPSGQLNDFDAWPLASAFDSQDNLYIYEANRAQVRIYKNPFNNTVIKPGDYNQDGAVNTGDLTLLINTWASTTDLRADGNGNNRVDIGDLTILINNWGN